MGAPSAKKRRGWLETPDRVSQPLPTQVTACRALLREAPAVPQGLGVERDKLCSDQGHSPSLFPSSGIQAQRLSLLIGSEPPRSCKHKAQGCFSLIQKRWIERDRNRQPKRPRSIRESHKGKRNRNRQKGESQSETQKQRPREKERGSKNTFSQKYTERLTM